MGKLKKEVRRLREDNVSLEKQLRLDREAWKEERGRLKRKIAEMDEE